VIDALGVREHIHAQADYGRPFEERSLIRGHGVAELFDEFGNLKQRVEFENLITQYGNQFYAERAGGVSGAPAAATGMQLGTGTTTPATTGAGAAIVTLVAASLVALTGTPTGGAGAAGTSRRAQYIVTWGAGTATANSIAEVVLTNQSTGTQTAAPAGATIARALLSPVVNKGAGDSLTVTWNHDIGA
jgi:hypothetical protein